ncbi:GNAT family N-acetyltransferase [Bacillus salacetis]|uniref:GNAT family N-acetyltransferase n=1 Tax=Bacillus salacetis TaxID=2315464 RepID=UPI003BA1B2B5
MSWKLLEGKGYSTLEWSSMNEGLRDKDIEELKEAYNRIPGANKVTVVIPAGNIGLGIAGTLQKLGLKQVKEREVYYKDLRETTDFPDSSLEYICHPSTEEAQRCLSLILGSPEEAERMLDGLYTEVERDKFRIYLVRKAGKDAGFFIPHIEPYTKTEGRIFFFGITPQFRGQGLASEVHNFAAASLRMELKADSYIGTTDVQNLPMKKVFQKNGCVKIQSIKIYSR